MANYSQTGGYRPERSRNERDLTRQSSSDYRPGDTGHVHGAGEHQSRDDGFAGRDDAERNSRYGRSEQWASDDRGLDSGYGDTEQSRAWARESYRGNPSSFSYEPGSGRVNQAVGERYGADYRTDRDRAASGRYGSDERFRDNEDYGQRRGFMERAGDEVASWFGSEKAEQRRMMDEHRGKGPKGYQRSDARIEEDVNDRLSDDPVLDASNISVLVKEAEVTLEGFVNSRWDKRRAEDLVDDISGVKHVQNNLRVGNGASTLSGSTTV
jgi:osmotically-inducible protein OsmY